MSIKRGLANYTRVQYTDTLNGTHPFATSVSGIPPYDPAVIKKRFEEFITCKLDSVMDAKMRASKMEASRLGSNGSGLSRYICLPCLEHNISSVARQDLKSLSTVVNGCLISWRPLGSVNAGYIQTWANKNLDAWDCSLERRAGNIDTSASWSAQHFSVTSYSSLMALIGTVVYQYKTTGTISPSLCKAFTSIRLLLFMDASRDEILAPAS